MSKIIDEKSARAFYSCSWENKSLEIAVYTLFLKRSCVVPEKKLKLSTFVHSGQVEKNDLCVHFFSMRVY